MIFDSHIHINTSKSSGIGTKSKDGQDEFEEFKCLIEQKELGVIVNASSIWEYRELSQIKGAYLSFGVHPWNAEEFFDSEKDWSKRLANERKKIVALEPYFRAAHVIGEIGMDSVWCQCNMNLQRILFTQQLEMAQTLGKPVVLHTKGMEKEIAEILKDYSMRKLVHWYSCNEHLEDYIEQDCYFTIGPGYENSPSLQHVMQQVAIDRLLVETDGISAVEWALDRQIEPKEVKAFLEGTVAAIAESKGLDVKSAEKALEENFHRFVGA